MEWNEAFSFVILLCLIWGFFRQCLPVNTLILEQYPSSGLNKTSIILDHLIFYDRLTYIDQENQSRIYIRRTVYFILPMKLQKVERLGDFQMNPNKFGNFEMYLFL